MGGYVTTSVDEGISLLPKIGTDDCKGYWIGVVQGPKSINGTYQWVYYNEGKDREFVTKAKWKPDQPNGKQFQPCVYIDKKDTGVENNWADSDCSFLG